MTREEFIGHNHRHATHKVYMTCSGYCVKFTYKDYIISVSSDGDDVCVFKAHGEGACEVFTGETVGAICDAKSYIDNLLGE